MSRPFSLPEEEATLSVVRTADLLQQRVADLLKAFSITTSQYNVLRILRGSPDGLACRQISERLLTYDPDVTRLLDRMERRRWMKRKRSLTDRRVVIAALTSAGNELLEQLTPVINSFHRRQFGGWGENN